MVQEMDGYMGEKVGARAQMKVLAIDRSVERTQQRYGQHESLTVGR